MVRPLKNTLEQFIQMCVSAYRAKKPEAAQLFEAARKMAGDPNALPEYQMLGKVLQKIMLGEKNPDLSGLPEELAQVVREALGDSSSSSPSTSSGQASHETP